jgi:predicted acylesterase/phospholipase RssA
MQYDMVFEGGGAKGMVFVGAMQEFLERGHTHGRLLGTSAGAITAALLAAGYTAKEMQDALAEKENGVSVFTSFMGIPERFDDSVMKHGALRKVMQDIDLPLLGNAAEEKIDDAILGWMAGNKTGRHILSFVEYGGWYSADKFLEWLTRRLNSGTTPNGQTRNFGGMTLAEFYHATQKDLTLVAADNTDNIMLILNHRTAPLLPVIWAVRMSMSIPLLWQEVIWRKEWGYYRGKEMKGHAIVDGGLLSNFPVELFISDDKNVTEVMGPKTSDHVIGFLIDENLEVPGAPPKSDEAQEANKGIDFGELATIKRLLNLVNTMLQARDKAVISSFEQLVVRLPAKGYGTTEFDMTDERRKALLEAGQKKMKTFIDRQSAAAVSFAFEEAPSPQEIADSLARKMLG